MTVNFCIIAVLLWASGASAEVQAKCEDSTWSLSEEGSELLCFKSIAFPEAKSFEEGQALCESQLKAYAAPFRGENDRKAIRESIERTTYRNSYEYYKGFFIGIMDMAKSYNSPFDFRHVHDKTPITFTSWWEKEPSQAPREALWEKCVIALVNKNLKWNNGDCSINSCNLGIVCAKAADKKVTLKLTKEIYYTGYESDAEIALLKKWNGTVSAVKEIKASQAELTIPV